MKHDLRKEQRPAYSIGQKLGKQLRCFGPGPATYELTNVTRHGKQDKPAFTFGASGKTLATFKTPAANTYTLPDVIGSQRPKNCYSNRSPDFHIGIKLKNLSTYNTPGPNQYSLPLLIGGNEVVVQKGPAYSIGNRMKNLQKCFGPGPAAYLPTQPAYKILPSMKFRHNVELKSFTPGPNNYDLQYFKPGKSSPAYSIGIKLSDAVEPYSDDKLLKQTCKQTKISI